MDPAHLRDIRMAAALAPTPACAWGFAGHKDINQRAVETLPAGLRPLFAANAHDSLNPASNVKMVSTATALELLGPSFRYTTRLLGREPDAGQDTGQGRARRNRARARSGKAWSRNQSRPDGNRLA